MLKKARARLMPQAASSGWSRSARSTGIFSGAAPPVGQRHRTRPVGAGRRPRARCWGPACCTAHGVHRHRTWVVSWRSGPAGNSRPLPVASGRRRRSTLQVAAGSRQVSRRPSSDTSIVDRPGGRGRGRARRPTRPPVPRTGIARCAARISSGSSPHLGRTASVPGTRWSGTASSKADRGRARPSPGMRGRRLAQRLAPR